MAISYAAIGSDMMTVYEIGRDEEEVISEAKEAIGDPDAILTAVPISDAAFAYVDQYGRAPDPELVITRYGVTPRSENKHEL